MCYFASADSTCAFAFHGFDVVCSASFDGVVGIEADDAVVLYVDKRRDAVSAGDAVEVVEA